jgi:hypothetical protein
MTPTCGTAGHWCHGACIRAGCCVYASPDRAQLAALSTDAPARAHAARVERERVDREAGARDHWAD